MFKNTGCSINSAQANEYHHDYSQVNTQKNNKKIIDMNTKVLYSNAIQANKNCEHFSDHGVLAINLMGSPGSGKTTLLEATIDTEELLLTVIEGDLETNKDVDRTIVKGALAHQIATGQESHLNASMVHECLYSLPIAGLDAFFVENVDNLVYPTSYELGTHFNVVLLSIPEGDDKPDKYPVMFEEADVLLITKCDLLPHFDFSIEKVIREARKLNPKIDIIEIDSKSGKGIDQWINYLKIKKELL